MKTAEVILAHGHENIVAENRTTLEITRETHLSKRGDCIVGVSADKGIADLNPVFKENLRKENSKLVLLIEAGKIAEVVNASGSSALILTHVADMVVRKSDCVCSRTLAIQADKAACDLSRKLVDKLRNPKQKVKITLTVNV